MHLTLDKLCSLTFSGSICLCNCFAVFNFTQLSCVLSILHIAHNLGVFFAREYSTKIMTHATLSTTVVIGSTLGVVVILGVLFWSRRQRVKYHDIPLEDIPIPSKWRKVGEVKELVIYPLKGARRKCVQNAEFTRIGLRENGDEMEKLKLLDRLFVLINEKHEFLSIKTNTKVLFVNTEAIDDCIVKFSYPESSDLMVEIPDENSALDHVEIYFGEKVSIVDCGDEAASWFSERLLGRPNGLKLGCFVPALVAPRSIHGPYTDHAKVYTKFHSEYMGTYHNLASYMLMSEASVTDLNNRVNRSPVNEHYFRPNIVIRGSPAYSEDSWDWIKIGDNVVLRGFKCCTRCTITTVDPDTGVRDPKVEPLKTLRTYRTVKGSEQKKIDGNSPVMGLYAGCHQVGLVKVGDPVYVSP